MALDHELEDGSDLNRVEILQVDRNSGFFENPNLCEKSEGVKGYKDKDRLRSLFDQLLSSFLNDLCVKEGVFRPFPPKLDDGHEADLFKLFWMVRRNGGYELISNNELWEFVAEECGLEFWLVASLKLVYVKYLKEFDQWLSQGECKDNSTFEKFDSLARELEEYRELNVTSDGEVGGFEVDKKGKSVVLESGGNGGMVSEKNDVDVSEVNGNEGGMNIDLAKTRPSCSRINGDDDKFSVEGDKRTEVSPENVVKGVDFLKVYGDGEEISVKDGDGMELSHDNVVQKVDVLSMDDESDERLNVTDDERVELTINNVVNQVLGLITKNVDGNNVTSHKDNDTITFDKPFVENVVSSQKRKRKEETLVLSKMLDWIADVARDPRDTNIGKLHGSSKSKSCRGNKLRAQVLLARRVLFAKRNLGSGNEACGSQKKNQRMHPSMYDNDKRPAHLPSRNKRHKPEAEQTPETVENQKPKSIDVGPDHQAEVPEWTGVVSESDPKWLGTRMWPPPTKIQELDPVVGLGRQGSCECTFPGSAECVRFHIAENKLKLKLELGALFFKWKFNDMGEEATLSWEPEEEQEFERLVTKARQEFTHSTKSKHEIMSRFWRRASRSIPEKTKRDVVNYYFNVFVLRRRSYQNRVMRDDIDSDDDEREVGLVGDRFGYEKVHGLSLRCSENKQCMDLES